MIDREWIRNFHDANHFKNTVDVGKLSNFFAQNMRFGTIVNPGFVHLKGGFERISPE